MIFIRNHNTPLVKANNQELSYLLLFALIPCYLSSLLFIGYPTREVCLVRQSAFGMSFVLSVSCILAKTITVMIAFNATKPNSNLKKWVGHRLPYCVVVICSVIQFIICVTWLSISSPFLDIVMPRNTGKIIIECNECSLLAFWCMLGYMGFLALVSFVVAFLARNLPDNFNEARHITFSMLIFVSVWLVFIPAYVSTKGKYMVAVEVFAITSSSAGILSCIFIPKCYIIVMHPEMNTREYLMGKQQISSRI
ncbi:vomeronasal type-2 receptor 26-like [Protopterus annectens]|uniref:vomeronasal type-2 receptor 26-like n=1 Tax=Protopterus annectens TaxID=7888 RepID=UPI001CF99AB2|nr:vomeronasal type-2 receptor 26-like [Protopterus annectens]